MSDNENQLALIEDDFKVTGSDWVHLFRYVIETGDLAKFSGGAWKVYCVIKLLSGFEDGKTTASYEKIGEMSGMSTAAVKRAIKELRDSGYLFSERKGRKNTYQIIEKIPGEHVSGSPTMVAEIPYQRKKVTSLVSQIRGEVIKALTGTVGVEGIRDINIVINQGTIHNLNIGSEENEELETVNVEFDPVDELQDLPWKK